MDISEACGFIQYLLEKDNDDKLFFRWSVGFQSQMSFDEFKEALRPPKAKTEKEVLDDVEDILNNYTWR